MEMMSDAAKKELHELVDSLPDEELHVARRFLEYLRDEATDPYAHLHEGDPFENMPEEERARLHAALSQSRRDVAEGKVVPAEEAISHLRARRR